MFTLNIRNIVEVGRGGVRYMASGPAINPGSSNSTYDDFFKKAKEGKGKEFLEKATSEERKDVLEKINSLPTTTDTKKLAWREAMKNDINRLNTPVAPVAPTPPNELAPNPVVEANPVVAATQVRESAVVIAAQEKEVVVVKQATIENIDGLKVEMVMTKLFQLDSNFFKGEITRVEKFQELITVVASCLKSGTTPKTANEWVKLGYSGEDSFEGFIWEDKKELAVVNGFLDNVKKNPQNAALVQYIATHAGNNEAAYKTVLGDLNKKILSTIAQKETSDTLDIKDGKIEKSQANSRIDALLGNDTLWSGFANRDDIKASIMRASENGKTLDSLYKRITGQATAPNWTDDRAILAASVDFRDALGARIAIMRAIGGGNAGLDSVLQGKEQNFAKAVGEYIKKNGEIKVEALDKNMNPTLINSLSGILSVAVAIGTAGVVTLRARGVEDITSDDILAKLLKDPKVEGADRGILGWVANLFVGRRFDLAIGNTDSHDAMRERLLMMARKIQGLTKDTKPDSITDMGLRTGFIEANKIGLLDKPEGIKAFQKYILEQAITNDALSEKDNTRWSASLNPLFAGIHRDGVSVDKFGSEISQDNNIETQATSTEVPLVSLGITATPDGKQFTIPQSLKDPKGVFSQLPVVIQNSDKPPEPITGESIVKTFDKPQELSANLFINNGISVVVVSFTEATNTTPAQVATVNPKPINVNDKVMATAAESARAALGGSFIDNITIRTKFAKLQSAISTISNETDVNTVFASLEKSPQLKSIFDMNKDKTSSEKYAVLLSILGEFAGDQRYRKLRLYQKNPTLLDKKEEMAYLRPLLHTIIGGKASDVVKMTDKQIKDRIEGLTMNDITRVTITPENEKFENAEMQKLGLTGVDDIRNSYREQDKTSKIYTDKTRTTEGFGFMMNHQVLGKKVTFAGVSALAPEMQVRDIEPIDVTKNMDKSKFIDRLNTLQIDRIANAINTAYSTSHKSDVIMAHLNGSNPIKGLDVSAKFYYAQFPNCTNDVLFMKIEGKGPTGAPIVVNMKGLFGTSTVIDTPVIRTNELDAGINLPAAYIKNKQDTSPPEKPTGPTKPDSPTIPGTPTPPITPPVEPPVIPLVTAPTLPSAPIILTPTPPPAITVPTEVL